MLFYKYDYGLILLKLENGWLFDPGLNLKFLIDYYIIGGFLLLLIVFLNFFSSLTGYQLYPTSTGLGG